MLIFVCIFLYWIVLIILYRLIAKRLKYLDELHAKNTWISELINWRKMTKTKIIVIFVVLFILSSLVFLTFIEDELLYQKWLYNNQETLDNNGF
jgi:ABC-type Fe3+ transport system permease subunit